MFKDIEKPLSLSILTILAVGIFSVLLPSSADKAMASSTITLTSDPAKNKVKYIEYRSWPFIEGNQPTPRETKNSTYPGITYKTMPWLAEDLDSNPTGNYYTQSGNSSTREVDGGSVSGAWLNPTAYGGWANAGALSWPTAVALTNGSTVCDTYLRSTNGDYGICPSWSVGAKTPLIWGMDHRFGRLSTERIDHYKDLFQRVFEAAGGTGAVSYNQNDRFVSSSGTTLFRNEFLMTRSQVDRLDSINLQIMADDFLKVYVNGVNIITGTTAQSTAITTLSAGSAQFETFKAALLANIDQNGENTPHVIAFQVSDKARWGDLSSADAIKNWTTSSNAVGLWYNIGLTYSDLPSCSISASPSPTSGSTTLAWTTTDATSASFSDGTAATVGTGSRVVNINADTSFTLNVAKGSEAGSCSTNVVYEATPQYTCSVVPERSEAPAVATATIRQTSGTPPVNPTYSFTIYKTPATLIDSFLNQTSATKRFTLSEAGDYQVQYSVNNSTPVPCGSILTVSNPMTGGGGEVAP